MTTSFHTMLRITDPARSRAFYEALGMEFRRESEIVRDGNHEATLYFFAFPGDDVDLELTYNTDGRSYELGTGYGHVAAGVDDLAETLQPSNVKASAPSASPIACAREARSSASSRTRTATGSS